MNLIRNNKLEAFLGYSLNISGVGLAVVSVVVVYFLTACSAQPLKIGRRNSLIPTAHRASLLSNPPSYSFTSVAAGSPNHRR